MKLIENISQKLFIRTNDDTGYDVVLEGDISMNGNAQDDKLLVYSDECGVMDTIDIPTAVETGVYIKSYMDKGVDACIIIMKNHTANK
jgi:hypothetical protein